MLALGKLKLPSSIYNISKVLLRKGKYATIALLTGPAVYSCSPMTFDLEFEPDDPRLRSSECLKNAAGIAVDASSAVLSQTVYAVQKIEKEYKELVETLTALTAAQVTALANQNADDVIADVIMETRQEIDKVKKRKQDLEILFSSAEKLCDATAEVAFASGMTFASTSIGERLHAAQQEIRRLQERNDQEREDQGHENGEDDER